MVCQGILAPAWHQTITHFWPDWIWESIGAWGKGFADSVYTPIDMKSELKGVPYRSMNGICSCALLRGFLSRRRRFGVRTRVVRDAGTQVDDLSLVGECFHL